jgi:uncharacterized membrane protein (Fun14 family)
VPIIKYYPYFIILLEWGENGYAIGYVVDYANSFKFWHAIAFTVGRYIGSALIKSIDIAIGHVIGFVIGYPCKYDTWYKIDFFICIGIIFHIDNNINFVIIYNDYYQMIDSNMSDSNSGCHHNRSIRDNLFIVYGILNNAINSNIDLDLTVYDIAKCFDSQWHEETMNDL